MDPSYFTPRAARISNWLELANEFRKTLGTPTPDSGEDVLEERVFDADPAPASIQAGSEEEAALLARLARCGADLGKAAADFDRLGFGAFGLVDLHRAVADRRHQRRMAFEHTEFAFRAGDDHHVDILGTDQLRRCDEFEAESHVLTIPRPAPWPPSPQHLSLSAALA